MPIAGGLHKNSREPPGSASLWQQIIVAREFSLKWTLIPSPRRHAFDVHLAAHSHLFLNVPLEQTAPVPPEHHYLKTPVGAISHCQAKKSSNQSTINNEGIEMTPDVARSSDHGESSDLRGLIPHTGEARRTGTIQQITPTVYRPSPGTDHSEEDHPPDDPRLKACRKTSLR